MRGSAAANASAEVVVVHPLDAEDAVITAAMRAKASSTKGVTRGIEARGQFDALMESILPRDDVTFEEDTLGGVAGLWVHPADWRSDEAILHLHGGWFSFGSANGFRHLVAHIAARAAARAFIPDYRLAPEHSFPAAPDDALACCQGLAKRDVHRIALTGDSAGGNLALGLASRITGEGGLTNATLVGVAVLSPVTDLTLSGASYDTRADADPFFTRPQVAELVHSYLKTADPKHSLASPLQAQLSGMPPVRIHVGSDEVLLDDSLRYVERAFAAGVDARVDVWTGMPHGFAGSVGRLKPAVQTLDAIGTFLAERRQAGAWPLTANGTVARSTYWPSEHEAKEQPRTFAMQWPGHDDLTLQEIADRLAVRELVDAYARCADRRDVEGQMSLFTADTEFLVYMDSRNPTLTQEIRGRDSLRPVFENLSEYEATTHFNGQSTVTWEQDAATGVSYCLAHHVKVDGQSRSLMIASIRYLDQFVKMDGHWYFR